MKSADGMCIIMLIIDLFSAWRRLFALPNRQANTVVRCLLDEWIYVRGCPQTIVSDADPALMSKVCQGLFQALNVKHIATFRYPQPNGKSERSFRVVGECFRRMDPSQRENWPRQLPKISFAANVTECPTTGELSAFQVEHGRSCRLPFDSQFVEAAQVLDERKMIGVYGQLAAASALYRKVAAEAADAARTASSERLNRAGGPGREVKFQVGDVVVIYLPPAAEKKGEGDESSAQWKAKHLLQWRGPCTVEAVLGGSTYKVREESTKRAYTRSVALIAHYHGDIKEVLSRFVAPAIVAQMLQPGSVVAVVDEPGEVSVWLVKVEDVKDGMVFGHYYSASSHDLAKAVFKLVWIEDRTGLSILGAPKRSEKAKPWSGSVPDEDEFVKARGLVFRKDGVLTAKSKNQLKGFTASMVV